MADYVFYKGIYRGNSQTDTIPSPVGKYLKRRQDTDTGIRYYSDGFDWIKSGTPIGINDVSGPITGKKIGKFEGTSTANGSGLFGTFNTAGTAGGVGFDNINGSFVRYDTTNIAGNTANFRYANPFTTRAWNASLGVRFMINVGTNNRVHIGFKQAAFTAPVDGTDDPLANTSGIMLVQRPSASANNFEIATNNGAVTSNFTPTAIPVTANTLYEIKFRALSDLKFQWSLNDSQWFDITTQIPASITPLGNYNGIQTAEAVIHQFRIYAIEATSDK